MEVTLAFFVTLLAIFLGFLYIKRLAVVRGVSKLIDLLTINKRKAGNSDNTNCAKGPFDSKKHSWCKEFQDELNQSNRRKLSSHSPCPLSPTDNHGNTCPLSPVKVKDFIQMLREDQQNEMTEEEMKEEKRIQKKQLEEIFQLMKTSQNQYGIDSLDDMEEQMQMYAVGQ